MAIFGSEELQVQGAYGDISRCQGAPDSKRSQDSGIREHALSTILNTLSYNWPYSWFVPLAGSCILHQYVQNICGGIYSGKGEFPLV